MASKPVTCDELTSQSVVSFVQVAKTLHSLTCHVTLMKINIGLGEGLAKWSKQLHQRLCGLSPKRDFGKGFRGVIVDNGLL